MSSFSTGPVCVTGASGYVASHVVRELLARGASVHGTVRDPSDTAKVAHLEALATELPGTLKLFRADLLENGSFEEAIRECEVVIHTASPFTFTTKDPMKELVEPALNGTINVLQTVEQTPSVRRVVLTSSIVACQADAQEVIEHGGLLDESHWNGQASVDYRPYSYSKTQAERKAWELAEGQDRWRLAVMNPGFVMGPSLTKRNDSQSIDFLLSLIDGRLRSGLWTAWTGWVDVRDVAIAHVEAAVRPDAEGRHLLVCEVLDFWTVIDWLAEDFEGKVKLPAMRVPKWLAYLIGPLNGFSMRLVQRDVGVPFKVDNTRSKERLGIAYRPLRTTIKEHVEQLIADGLYSP